MQPILLFVLVLVLVLSPLTSHAITLTGADLPGQGDTLTITENTQFLISQPVTWGGGTIRIGEGLTVDFLNTAGIHGSGNINNCGGIFNFKSDNYLSGGFNVTNACWGTINFLSNSTFNGTLNFETDGAWTNLQNNGQFSGTLNVLDQYNKTYILNNGTISAPTTLNLTANGTLGNIQITNNGLITDSVLNNLANEGGKIIFDNTFGSADFRALTALTRIYGTNSSFQMLYSRNVTVDVLRVYGQSQDASFLAAGLNRTFADPDSGSRVIFNYVNRSYYLYLPMVLK